MRGTLPQLRAWAQEGLHGVKWGALIMRISDTLQLLLQEVGGGAYMGVLSGPVAYKVRPDPASLRRSMLGTTPYLSWCNPQHCVTLCLLLRGSCTARLCRLRTATRMQCGMRPTMCTTTWWHGATSHHTCRKMPVQQHLVQRGQQQRLLCLMHWCRWRLSCVSGALGLPMLWGWVGGVSCNLKGKPHLCLAVMGALIMVLA